MTGKRFITAIIAALAIAAGAAGTFSDGDALAAGPAVNMSYNDGGGGGSQIVGFTTVLVQTWSCSPYQCNYYCRIAHFGNGWAETVNCWLQMDWRGYW